MIDVDRVYKTVKTLVNNDMRGNVTPSEFKLILHDVVEEIYEEYLFEVNRITNRSNRGLVNGGLENLKDRIRERIQYFLTDSTMDYGSEKFTIPANARYIDAVLYNNTTTIEPCKSAKEFSLLKNFKHTQPNTDYPIYLREGGFIKVLPDTIVDGVTIYYMRSPLMANWTYVVVGGAELFNPSASDFQNIDLHSGEVNNVVIRVLQRFGINLKEQDVQTIMNNETMKDFSQENAS